MYWYDENEIENFYTEKEASIFDDEIFSRENYWTIMQIDRKLTNIKNKVAMYEKMLLKDPTNHKIIKYLKHLNKQIDVQETSLYYFEEVVSGYSNRK